MTLSIIICTYNRSRLLEKCLYSLADQIVEGVEVIVVDNNSDDNTEKMVDNFERQIKNLSYQLEPNIGLSHARNRGIKEAKGDWVLYLDDDAIAFDDLVLRALYLCNLDQYDCVGGMYYGYFEGERPKWVCENFGTKDLYSKELTECPYNVPHGGIVLYRKTLLMQLNGFNSRFGMTGLQLKYGEEEELQFRLSQIKGKIGFDPFLTIHHLVKPNYATIKHFISERFRSGQAKGKILNQSLMRKVIVVCGSLLYMIFIKLPKLSVKLAFNKKYYYQNALIDLVSGPLFYLGKLLS